MVDIKRKKGESFEAMFRRFTKRIHQSGKIIQAKQGIFRQSEPNRNAKKKSALIRLQTRKEKEYLRRIGKLEEDTRRRW